jgi:PilZ domain
MVASAQEGCETRHDQVIDRRLTVRYASEHHTFFQPLASDTRVLWQARVRDISDNGMGLILHRAFDPGMELSIELPAEVNHPLRFLTASIVHVTALDDGQWLVGCEFLEELNQEEIDALRQMLA